jgi:hypothetical protein
VTAARALLAAALAALAAPTAAADDAPWTPRPIRCEHEGPFLGERYRWAAMPVLPRVLNDLVAIPANVPAWSAGDWAELAAWTAGVAALMAPLDDPYDARLDRWIRREMTPHLPVVWNDVMQPLLWGGIAVGGLGTWWWAASSGRDDIAQGLSLMGEALAVTQAYHLTFKLLIGREGPTNGDGRGQILGPFQAVSIYPAGTPSGHAGTLYSLMSAGFAYYRPPAWLQVGGHLVVGGLVAFHVIDHRHFLSDVVWGGAMGWYVGRWVVAHRSSPVAGRPAGASRAGGLTVIPFLARGGGGLAASARW